VATPLALLALGLWATCGLAAVALARGPYARRHGGASLPKVEALRLFAYGAGSLGAVVTLLIEDQ